MNFCPPAQESVAGSVCGCHSDPSPAAFPPMYYAAHGQLDRLHRRWTTGPNCLKPAWRRLHWKKGNRYCARFTRLLTECIRRAEVLQYREPRLAAGWLFPPGPARRSSCKRDYIDATTAVVRKARLSCWNGRKRSGEDGRLTLGQRRG